MKHKRIMCVLALTMAASLMLSIAACNTVNNVTSDDTSSAISVQSVSEDGISNYNDGEHAIEVSGKTEEYSNVTVTKTGSSSSGDEADFYGDNAAIFATEKATLTLKNITVNTDGTHANAVFSYGEGTTVNISNSTITTTGDCSGGLMTTGGGTMNASNLTIHTTGNSSAAIRSDRGGGTVTVDGGSYTTDGTGSPAIYSTADITVSNASLESTASQGVVVEGKNSVTLNDVQLVANNTTANSDKSNYYQAVMIYQSMSGDAAQGLAVFNMTGGSLTNKNGDVFFVNNTATTITLEVVNEDADGVFLRAEAAGWGSEGSNGGKVNLYLKNQTLDGDITVDKVSALNLYMSSSTTYSGAVNSANAGEVYVEIEKGSKWILTGDSYVSSLTCDEDGIDLNGYTLYVNGTAYTSGTKSTGEAIEIATESSSNGAPSGDMPSGNPPSGDPPSGTQGEPPSGERPSDMPEPPSGERPELPSGSGDDSNRPEPPSKPDDQNSNAENQ